MKFLTVPFLALALIGCAQGPGEPVWAEQDVLSIGDSISIGYQPFIANSVHNPGNASTATHTRDRVEQWLGGKMYRTIVFNNGLHDVMYNLGKVDEHAAEYKQSLEATADIILKHTPNPIFVLSTHCRDADYGAWNADTIQYNQMAREIMARKGIRVVDLWTLSLSLTTTDGVHYDEASYRVLADEVSRAL